MKTNVNLKVENEGQNSRITYLKDLERQVPFTAIAGYSNTRCVGIRVNNEVLYFHSYVTDGDGLTMDTDPNISFKNVRYFDNIDVRIY